MGAGGTRAHTENGLTRLTSRDARENSNARFVRAPFGRAFIAPVDLPADEIFSPDFGSKPGNPAVDRQRLRVDVNALVGDEKQRRIGDFPACRHPPERHARRASRRPAGAGLPAERRIDQARIDDVGANAAPGARSIFFRLQR
jgi:hypothetical protein